MPDNTHLKVVSKLLQMNVYLCTKIQNPLVIFLLQESLYGRNESVADQRILKSDWPKVMSEIQKTQKGSLKLLSGTIVYMKKFKMTLSLIQEIFLIKEFCNLIH